MRSKDLWTYATVFNSTVIINSLENNFIPSLPLYILSSVMAFLGLLGNVLVFSMTRHPDLKDFSCRVHFAFLAIVDTLELACTLGEVVADAHMNRDELMGSSVALCKVGSALRQWIGDMAVWGLLGLVLDRYVALLSLRLKTLICTSTNARLMCSLNAIVTFVISITCSATFFVMTFPGWTVCVEDSASVHFFYLASSITGVVPAILMLFFTTHAAAVFFRGNGSLEGEANTDRQTSGTTLVLSLVCILTVLPRALYEILEKYFFIKYVEWQNYGPESRYPFTNLFGISDVISLVSCVNLSCKAYLLLTSRFFRRWVRETLPPLARSRRSQPTEVAGGPRHLATLPGRAIAERSQDAANGSSAVNPRRPVYTVISLEPSTCHTELKDDDASENDRF